MIKTFTIVATLLAGGVSLAIAQSGPPTGGYPSVAGGAAGNPGFIEYKMPSGQTVKLRTMKHRGQMMVLVPMSMSCDVFHVNC
jgi:hypothetical protein